MPELLLRIIADGLIVPIVLIGGFSFLILVRSHWIDRYKLAFMAGLSAYVAAKIMSLFVSTTRPFVSLGVAPGALYLDNPGFPSDHVLFAATITLVVYLSTRRRSIGLILAALTLLVAYGRVAALVHTPLDVIGGLVAACIGVLPWYILRKRIDATVNNAIDDA